MYEINRDIHKFIQTFILIKKNSLILKENNSHN